MSSLKDVLSCTLDALDDARDLYQIILAELHGSVNDQFFEKYSRDRLCRFNDEVQQAQEHFKDVYVENTPKED